MREIAWNLRKMGWDPEGKVQFQPDRLSGDVEEDKMLMKIAKELAASGHAEEFVRGVVVSDGPYQGERADALASLRNGAVALRDGPNKFCMSPSIVFQASLRTLQLLLAPGC